MLPGATTIWSGAVAGRSARPAPPAGAAHARPASRRSPPDPGSSRAIAWEPCQLASPRRCHTGAGDDIDAAVLYPEDARYLVGESTVTHYQVVAQVQPAPGQAREPHDEER